MSIHDDLDRPDPPSESSTTCLHGVRPATRSPRRWIGHVTFARGESLCQLVPVPHATFRDARAWEAPVELVEPEFVAEYGRWKEERLRGGSRPFNFHHLYRRAESIEGHQVKVAVPPVAFL